MKSLKISASLSRRISQFNNNVTFFHKQLELVILLSNLFFSQSDSRIFRKFEFLFHENSQYAGVWKYCGVYKRVRCMSKNRLYTKMLGINVFSIAPLGLLIAKTLTNVL